MMEMGEIAYWAAATAEYLSGIDHKEVIEQRSS